MAESAPPPPRSASGPLALTVIPHPDDESYSFAGTLALLTRSGWRVAVLALTSGEKGKRHDGGPAGPENVGPLREIELAMACDVIGAEAPMTWRLPDGGLKDLAPPTRRLRALILALQPRLLFSLGSDGAYGHPDHVVTYRWLHAAWSGLPAGDRPPWLAAAFATGLFLPQYQKCIGMMGVPPDPAASAIGAAIPTHEVDIRSVRDAKWAALAAHRSQLPGGDPGALFPPGIVAQLLEKESFVLVSGSPGLSEREGVVVRRTG